MRVGTLTLNGKDTHFSVSKAYPVVWIMCITMCIVNMNMCITLGTCLSIPYWVSQALSVMYYAFAAIFFCFSVEVWGYWRETRFYKMFEKRRLYFD